LSSSGSDFENIRLTTPEKPATAGFSGVASFFVNTVQRTETEQIRRDVYDFTLKEARITQPTRAYDMDL